MEQHPDYTRKRIRQVVERLQERLYPEKIAVPDLRVSPRVERISYAQAQLLRYRPTAPGAQFGPLWATFWFRGRARVPRAWAGSRATS